jgi:prepilin-type N-terminal cleavage/methylation domain-containing protein
MRRFTLLRSRLARRAACDRGFSLIEMLVTILIMGIVIGALTTPFMSASKAELDMNSRFQAQEQARIGLDQLRRELHCASQVTQLDGVSALTAGTSYSGVRVTLGSQCSPTGTVTWCTAGSPATLYRIGSGVTTCSTSGARPVANYLTNSQPFSQATTASGALPALHVVFTVNVRGASATTGTSTLVDDIALRNVTRT